MVPIAAAAAGVVLLCVAAAAEGAVILPIAAAAEGIDMLWLLANDAVKFHLQMKGLCRQHGVVMYC